MCAGAGSLAGMASQPGMGAFPSRLLLPWADRWRSMAEQSQGHAGPSDRGIRLKAVAQIAAIALLALIGAGFAETMAYRATTSDARADAIAELGGVRSLMESRLNADVQLTRGLISYIKVHPDLDQQEFARLAGDLIASGQSHIRNIGLARDLVISHVYPIAGNEAALGLDYRKVPAQWPMVEQSIRERRGMMAGPLDLVQGGVGLISRFPIFLDMPASITGRPNRDHAEPPLWGIVSTVIDFPAFLDSVGLPALQDRYRLLLAGRNGTGAGGDPFWGDAAVLSQNPVTLNIALVSGEWLLAAVPVDGWPSWSRHIPLIGGLTGALFLLAVGVVLLQMRSELAQARTGRLLEAARNEAVASRIAAERASAAKSHFLANMSHDLRTPLNSIIGFSEMIRREVFGPGWHPKYGEYVGHIHDCGQSLVAMINDILDLAKIETEDYRMQVSDIDMPALLREIATSWQARLGKHRVELRLAPDAPVILQGDPLAVRRILENLLSNAQHYAGDEATILILWTPGKAGDACLGVVDDGAGIPADQIPSLVEPFYQGGSDHGRHAEQTRRAAGHGLGLSIVKRFAELHDGGLRIESELGQGAAFYIDFPAARLTGSSKVA